MNTKTSPSGSAVVDIEGTPGETPEDSLGDESADTADAAGTSPVSATQEDTSSELIDVIDLSEESDSFLRKQKERTRSPEVSGKKDEFEAVLLNQVEFKMVQELKAQQRETGERPTLKGLSPEEACSKLNQMRNDQSVNFNKVARIVLLFLPGYQGIINDKFIQSLLDLLKDGRKIDDIFAIRMSNSTLLRQNSKRFVPDKITASGTDTGLDPENDLAGRYRRPKQF